MTHLFDLEISWILWLRQTIPGLVGPFEVLTYLGNELFFLLFLPFVYWCIDRWTGVRVIVILIISAASNEGIKELFRLPRPIDYAPDRLATLFRVPIGIARQRYEATGYGFPSGHTENATAIWGYLTMHAHRLRGTRYAAVRSVFLALAILLIVLVPLSRIYLAVHFPHDVVGGYVIGAALLFLYLWLEPGASRRLAGVELGWQLTLATVVPALAMVLFPREIIVTAGSAFMGLGIGFAAERRWLHYASAGEWWQRALRYPLGMVGVLILYAGLKVAFAALEPALIFRFIRYVLIGLWASVGAPWIFIRAGLAASDS